MIVLRIEHALSCFFGMIGIATHTIEYLQVNLTPPTRPSRKHAHGYLPEEQTAA
jgi:hypothetical protein